MVILGILFFGFWFFIIWLVLYLRSMKKRLDYYYPAPPPPPNSPLRIVMILLGCLALIGLAILIEPRPVRMQDWPLGEDYRKQAPAVHPIPADPEQQRKLQEELQKRADDARKKLEAQQPVVAAPAPAAPPK
jgi:hypothetical protein